MNQLTHFLSSNAPSVGQDMMDLIAELYPICRSITGDGVRQTLAILERFVPLQIHEVPSGSIGQFQRGYFCPTPRKGLIGRKGC
jgi:aminopeptidase-like protein